MTVSKATQMKAAELERKHIRYFGSQTKPEAVRRGTESRFEIFTMYKPASLTYTARTAR